ncbi:MAG: MBOAT family protein [Lachnospira sp.]|nr:MBOAT family protein [Lachnospira sp.]
MLFTSLKFVAFVIAVLFLYYAVPKKFQWVLLLCANLFFYIQAGIYGLVFILVTIATTYISALSICKEQENIKRLFEKYKDILTKEDKKMYKAKSKRTQKLYMILCLIVNIGILAVLKYTNFFILNFTNMKPVNFILPMGISFYTFQSMGYLIDVYRGTVKAERNPARFALFISFFPQLVQGPINRWKELSSTLFSYHTFSWKVIQSGVERVIWGYFKKLVIADRAMIGLAVITSDNVKYSGAYALLGMLLYAVELYADFTGGIDVTIGIAEMFGIKLAENFKRPFFSKSIAEYWRRWHITLCAWFKDYLFYPISMSKWMNKLSKAVKKKCGNAIGSRLPVYISSIVVWFVTGLWHGASWNFIVWGLLNCAVMLISQELEPVYEKVENRLHYRRFRYYKVFEILRTTFIVCSLQMLDYYYNISDAFRMYISIFTTANYGYVLKTGMWNIGLKVQDYAVLILGVLIIFIVSMLQRKRQIRKSLDSRPFFVRFIIFLLLFLAIASFGIYGIGYESSQFIYNQF